MIRRILFALACTASIPAILGPQPVHAAPAMTRAPIQMAHISVTVTGKGSPVILIPGLSSPRAVWDGVAPDLAKTHSVYVVQINGFGGDDPRANLQPGILAGVVEDLHSLVAQQKLTGAAVVGHSMGGLLGLMLAKAHPQDLGKLMIVDSLPFYATIFMPTATVAMVEPQAKAMRDQMAASYPKPDEANIARVANALALKPDSRATVTGWMRTADARVSAEAMYEDLTTDLRADLPSIATPITLVYPWSSMLPKEKAEPFYKTQYAGAPHVRFVDIADSAHFAMLDQPDAFKAALLAFLG